MKMIWHALILGVLISPSLAGGQQAVPSFGRRWVWMMCNLQVAKEADRVVALIERANKSGYTSVVISDYKLNFLDRVPDHYFKNVERVKDAAKANKVELIPAVFPMGYANGLLSNDVNLAEGLPVTDAEFSVKNGKAELVPSNMTVFRNGDLEKTRADRFLDFSHQDEPSKCTVADRDERHGGAASCRMQRLGETPNCRLIQSVKTRRHGAYRFSAWIKTKDLSPTGAFRLLAIGKDGRILTFHEGGIDASADWKQVEVVFNSLENAEVNLYVGVWGGRSGTLWLDDLELNELGLTNVLRRLGCPLVVKSADGQTTYAEGTDFEPVADPLLGKVPYEGEYAFNHPSPPIRLTAKSRIKEGDRLLVSWYHPVLVHGNVVMCCLSEPKVYALLEDQARRVNELFHPTVSSCSTTRCASPTGARPANLAS